MKRSQSSLQAVQIALEGKSSTTAAAERLTTLRRRIKSRGKLLATFSEQSLVEVLDFGGS